MKEQWKDIKDYEGYYQVSTYGRVRGLDRLDSRGQRCYQKELVGNKCSNGYISVSLCKNAKQKQYHVHRLVLETFIGLCPEGMECCHFDGDRTNNHITNLRWATHSDNMYDAVRHKTHSGGLLKRKVIRSDGAEFQSTCEAARVTGVGQSHVSAVCRGSRKSAGGFGWKYKETN